MLIYQLSLYPSVERTCGPARVARFAGVRFHLNLTITIDIVIHGFVILTMFGFHQALSIPLLQSYPFIALLSGFTLRLMINIASALKNLMSVSDPVLISLYARRTIETLSVLSACLIIISPFFFFLR